MLLANFVTLVLKWYLSSCLFTCMVTRVVHLEVVTSLSTACFMNELKRFVVKTLIPLSRGIVHNGLHRFQVFGVLASHFQLHYLSSFRWKVMKTKVVAENVFFAKGSLPISDLFLHSSLDMLALKSMLVSLRCSKSVSGS